MIRTYGRKPGALMALPHISIPEGASAKLPSFYSYQYGFEPIFDQGARSTCVANVQAALKEFTLKKRGLYKGRVSRRAIYAQAKRAYEQDDIHDDGLASTDGIRVEMDYGYVLESEWGYLSDSAPVDTFLSSVPTGYWIKDDLYTSFVTVPTSVQGLKLGLVHGGPVAIAVNFPRQWENDIAYDGLAPYKGLSLASAGGHELLIDDYDDNRLGGTFGIRNSWGSSFGDKGRFYLPYDCINSQLSSGSDVGTPVEAYTVVFH